MTNCSDTVMRLDENILSSIVPGCLDFLRLLKGGYRWLNVNQRFCPIPKLCDVDMLAENFHNHKERPPYLILDRDYSQTALKEVWFRLSLLPRVGEGLGTSRPTHTTKYVVRGKPFPKK